jgi:peptide/nickel transport system substrate-binding protein
VLALISLLSGITAASATASTGANKIQRGGTLTVAVVGPNYPGFDPQGTANVASIPEYYALYDPLFYPNDASGGAGVYPGLALSYKTSSGGRDLTFTLRQGVKFSDGTPWNAQAFVFNIRRSWDPVQNSECIADMSGYVGTKLLGPYKAEIMFNRPNPAYISLISGAQCGLMVSPAAVGSEGTQFGLHPVGTGPFTLQSWTAPSGTATLVANPHYYQKGFPLVSSLVFQSFGTTQSADACLQAGQCQLEEATTAAEQSALYTNSSLKFIKIPNMVSPYPVWLQVGAADNVKNTPFSNPQARLAVAESINQPAIISSLFTASNGAAYGEVSDGPITPGSFAYTKNKNYPKYNPTAAAAIVQQLGGLTFTLNCGNIAINISECDELQAMWQAVGMKVTIAPYPAGTEVALNHQHLFQATSLIANLPSPPIDPDIIIARNFVSTSTLNQTGLQDTVMDAAIQKTEREFSYTARKALYAQWDKIYDKDLPWAMQFDELYWAVVTNTFHGVSVPWNHKGTFSQEYYVPWYSYWVSH